MLKRILFTLTIVLTTIIASAQDIVVVGQVLSAENSQPLEAASVWFKGTNIGCTTNEEGFFMLRSAEPQRTLIASVIGYKQRQIKLDYGKDQMIRIYLREDISLLDEVIAMPKQDEAILLLKNVYANRHINNPENITNINTTMNDITGINLTNIKNKTIKLFNGENTDKFLKDMNVDLLGELPMHRAITNYGSIELIEEEEEVAELFDPIVEKIIAKCKKKLML